VRCQNPLFSKATAKCTKILCPSPAPGVTDE
jgi:hypothetical protein